MTSKFPSIHFMALGAREVLKKRGLNEVLFLEWEFGNRDFGPIANRVKDAKPDFVWVGAIGLDGNLLLDAMKKIDYVPPMHFHMYPAPGPMVKSPETQERAVGDDLRGASAVHEQPAAAEFVKLLQRRARRRRACRTRRSRRRPRLVHRLADAGGGVNGDEEPRRQGDRGVAQEEPVDTIQGRLRFDGPTNYGDDLMRIKQVQNGKWVVVWPKEVRARLAQAADA